MRGGAFVAPDGRPLAAPPGLPNAHMRLYGGAQYHRAMAEFRAAVGTINCPDISREEIVNACGIDDFHDGAPPAAARSSWLGWALGDAAAAAAPGCRG